MRPLLAFLALLPCSVQAQPAGPRIEGAREEIYKRASGTDLKLYIFNPEGHTAADKRPAIVFFFGGGWTNGTPKQFEPHCRYLAGRGMVAIAADYRVRSRQGVQMIACVQDAKSAVRWLRQNAGRLGIAPDRIAAGGGSSGGHLSAAAGVIPGLDEPGEDLAISSRPDALVLFNPAVVLAPVAGIERPLPELPNLGERLGIEPAKISPIHHVGKGAPPTIIFHGRADTTVPYVTVELFAKKMIAAGNRCELVGFDGQRHGFFNYDREGNQYYFATLKKAVEFLSSLGYLTGPRP